MKNYKHMNEEDFFDEGYSPPAKVYRKGLNANFYEGEDLTEKEKPMENTNQYFEELLRRRNEGGAIWLIERKDAEKYLSKSMNLKTTNEPGWGVPEFGWSPYSHGISLSMAFLTKEDAEEVIEKGELGLNFREGGCPTCGNGSTEIEVHAVEHIFDSPEAN